MQYTNVVEDEVLTKRNDFPRNLANWIERESELARPNWVSIVGIDIRFGCNPSSKYTPIPDLSEAEIQAIVSSACTYEYWFTHPKWMNPCSYRDNGVPIGLFPST